jgi:site-specific recombinase XerD
MLPARQSVQRVADLLEYDGLAEQASLEALSTDTILAFKERWLSGGRSPRTVNQTIKILKRPFKIALEEGLIDRNPSKDVNRHYTHLELATVRRAVESISRLPGKAADTPQ